jgi:hypothetical protein
MARSKITLQGVALAPLRAGYTMPFVGSTTLTNSHPQHGSRYDAHMVFVPGEVARDLQALYGHDTKLALRGEIARPGLKRGGSVHFEIAPAKSGGGFQLYKHAQKEDLWALQFDRGSVTMVGEGRHLSESDNLSVKFLAYCHTPSNGRELVSTARTSFGEVTLRPRGIKAKAPSIIASVTPAPKMPHYLSQLAHGLAGTMDAETRRQFRQLVVAVF